MKKTKSIAILGVALVLGFSVGLSACGRNEYRLSNYQGENKDADGKTIYNTELFYSNTVQHGYPDPQVLDDTARTGYYYLFGTIDNFTTMRSKDLVNWEDVGPTFFQRQSDEVRKATSSNMWAPEVIYDGDDEMYYMFFSAGPEADGVASGNGVVKEAPSSNNYNMYVAVSEEPTGPYVMVDFTDESSCGAANLHNYNTAKSRRLTEEQAASGEYAYVIQNGVYYEAAYLNYYAKYCLFSPDELSKVFQKNQVGTGGSGNYVPQAGYCGTIDPHPYVDTISGNKYLYFKTEGDGWNINVVVEMENWLTPKWETAEYVTASGYYTIADWEQGVNGGISYEKNNCNEGAHVIYHKDKNGKGLYYFTFSVNDYGKSEYQVCTAVSENPTGPFRKLTEEEGGLLLCSSSTESHTVSGAGHHSFITIGDQTYIIYHRHRNYVAVGGDRYVATDELKWVTVKDINGQDMDVPYTNGPTDSLQPLPSAVSGYANVAEGMTAECSDGSVNTKYLTDGLLSVHKTANETFMSYIGETKITETSTFTFNFGSATAIRAIMVYNSALEKTAFYNISKIEFTLADGSTRVIRDVAFDTEQYCEFGGQYGDRLIYIVSGAAAFTEFYEIEVTSVKITVDVPEGQNEVGISEIKILGKA